MSKKGSDGVGYGKPPSHSKFKPGQSGNLLGRPKFNWFDNGDDAFVEALLKPVTVNVNGRKTKVHPNVLIAQRIVKDCINGDPKAMKLYRELTDFRYLSKSKQAEERFMKGRALDQLMKDTYILTADKETKSNEA